MRFSIISYIIIWVNNFAFDGSVVEIVILEFSLEAHYYYYLKFTKDSLYLFLLLSPIPFCESCAVSITP